MAGFRVKIRLLCCAVACAAIASDANQAGATWGERLGYPPGARALILHLTDMGMCYETNRAGADALESGAAQSVSAMVPPAWSLDFAQWARDHRGHDIGLTLTLTSEYEHYRWRPVLPASRIPTLVDPNGFLWRSVLQVSTNASAEEVEREVHAQIERALAAGVRPTHFNPHMGAMVARTDLAKIYLGMARKYWIPAVVVELTPQHIDMFRARGLPIDGELVELIRNYPLPKLDELRMLPMTATYEEKVAAFIETVRSLPPGIAQITLQPAVHSAALERITPHWQQRVWESQLLGDEQVQAFLKEEGVLFTDWREIMLRFEGVAPAAEESEAAVP